MFNLRVKTLKQPESSAFVPRRYCREHQGFHYKIYKELIVKSDPHEELL